MLLRSLIAAALAILPLARPAATEALRRGLFWEELPPDQLVERILQEMSPAEIIAQTLLVGWPEATPSQELLRWVRTRAIGGVKVFGHNGNDHATLVDAVRTLQSAALQSRHSIPLLVATDQEGGWVRHVKDGTSVSAGNMAIGAGGRAQDAYLSGYHIGQELRALGINMNFAPVVDVYSNPEAHIIGPRAFSADPQQTALFGVAQFRGLEQAGVIATAKHFPGHGGAAGDSHGITPVVDMSLDELWQRDLLPFRILIREGIPAILSGHLSFPAITPKGEPVTLSPFFSTTLLREQLGFDGLVITDDLYMGGVYGYALAADMGFDDLVLETIVAGSDMALLSRTPQFEGTIWRRLTEAYHNDPAARRRLRQAAGRVLRTKMRYLKAADSVPLLPDYPSATLPNEEAQRFFGEQAARSITVVRASGLPYRQQPDERLLLYGRVAGFLAAGRRFFPAIRQSGPQGDYFYASNPGDPARFRALAENYDTIIFCLSSPAELEILRAARDAPARIIVVSTLTPIYLRDAPWVESAIAVYGQGWDSFAAGFAVLRGDTQAVGQLPFRLEE